MEVMVQEEEILIIIIITRNAFITRKVIIIRRTITITAVQGVRKIVSSFMQIIISTSSSSSIAIINISIIFTVISCSTIKNIIILTGERLNDEFFVLFSSFRYSICPMSIATYVEFATYWLGSLISCIDLFIRKNCSSTNDLRAVRSVSNGS